MKAYREYKSYIKKLEQFKKGTTVLLFNLLVTINLLIDTRGIGILEYLKISVYDFRLLFSIYKDLKTYKQAEFLQESIFKLLDSYGFYIESCGIGYKVYV